MIKLIFKTLWARRTRNAWIMLELVIVTIIMWLMVDRVVVNSYIHSRDLGYDEDLLFTVELDEYKPANPAYDEAQGNQGARQENIMRILQRLRQIPGVEAATIANSSMRFNGSGFSINALEAADSVHEAYVTKISFYPGTDFFSTFGVKSRDGVTPYVEPDNLAGGSIITTTAAKAVFPNTSPIGQRIYDFDATEYGGSTNIIADVVGDVICFSNAARSLAYFESSQINNSPSDYILVARKAAGVSDKEMLSALRDALPQLKSGMVYTHNPQPYSSMRDSVEHEQQVSIGLSYAVMVFFMVNICLALIATFYVQIRSRSRDAGIMRAYGFRKGTLELMMIAEGWILTVLSWIIGTGLFFMIGLQENFTNDKFVSAANLSLKFFKIYNPMWYDDLLTRCVVLGSISLLILLVIVTIGIWLPARKIAHANPVDTIRDL